MSFRPWHPIKYSDATYPTGGELNKADIVAIKLLAEGLADPDAQKRAIKAIIFQIALLGEEPFFPDEHGGRRDTDYAAGMMGVGRKIQKVISLPMHLLTGEGTTQGDK